MDFIKMMHDYKSNVIQYLIFLMAMIIVGISCSKNNASQLPFYGPKDEVINGDTVYHTVPPFQFFSQTNDTVDEGVFKGKIYVADFFFATCKGICPKMSASLKKVQEKYKNNDSILIISHTVDPQKDSTEALLQYADQYLADPKKWFFVTGSKKELYDLARNGYFVTALEGDGGPDDFIHSEKLVLVDTKSRIRGFYDGTNSAEVQQLLSDIDKLRAE